MKKVAFVLALLLGVGLVAPASTQEQQPAPPATATQAPATTPVSASMPWAEAVALQKLDTAKAELGAAQQALEAEKSQVKALRAEIVDVKQSEKKTAGIAMKAAGEADAWEAATKCALGELALRPGCFLDIVAAHPGTKAAEVAKAQVAAAVKPVVLLAPAPTLEVAHTTPLPQARPARRLAVKATKASPVTVQVNVGRGD